MNLVNTDCEKCRFAFRCSKGKDGNYFFHIKYHHWLANVIWFLPYWYHIFHDYFKFWLHRCGYTGEWNWHGFRGFYDDLKFSKTMVDLYF